MERLTNTIRLHRRLNGDLTQAELADKVGVSRQTIIALERGKYNPSVLLALKLAETFGTSVEALFQIGESPSRGANHEK